MNFPPFRSVLATAFLAILTACGGSSDLQLAMNENPTITSAVLVQGGGASAASIAAAGPSTGIAPMPDCAAEGCNRLRIVDGLAEEARAAAAERAASTGIAAISDPDAALAAQ